MKKWYRQVLEDPKRQKRPIQWYIVLTVIGLFAPILLIGNRSVFWGPLWAGMLSVDIGFEAFRLLSIGVLFVYPFALLAFYLIAIFCRKYLPLTIAAFFDVLYTSVFVAISIYAGGLSVGAMLLMIGILGNLWFSFYFLSLWEFTKFQHKQPENA